MQTPLGILAKVRPVDRKIDAVPFILLLVCAGLLAILTANFVYAPGMYIGFNTVPAANTKNINKFTRINTCFRFYPTLKILSMRELDRIDLKILDVLQRDGRISMTELAEQVNLSATPCSERVKRLERDGVITGYYARVNPAALGKNLLIFDRSN